MGNTTTKRSNNISDGKTKRRVSPFRGHVKDICSAAHTGDVRAISKWIERGGELNRPFSGFSIPPLCLACGCGHLEAAKLLIQAGALIDMKRYDSPILFASKEGHKDIVDLLIRNGANVNVTTVKGQHPLHFASKEGHKDIVNLLIRNGANVNVTTVINVTTVKGQYPLHFASRQGHKDIVNLLIQNGAKLNVTTAGGYDPLHFASKRGHKDIVNLLIRNGANVNVTTVKGANANALIRRTLVNMTPLGFACLSKSHDKIEIILQLLCFGADISNASVVELALLKGQTSILLAIMQILDGSAGEGVRSLFSTEEEAFLYEIAKCIAVTLPGFSVSRRTFTRIRQFITYRNIFMAREYQLGSPSLWKIKPLSKIPLSPKILKNDLIS